jgi:hypothetical protein
MPGDAFFFIIFFLLCLFLPDNPGRRPALILSSQKKQKYDKPKNK